MILLDDYRFGDIDSLDVVVDEVQKDFYELSSTVYLRAFVTAERVVVAVGMVANDGEIGLIINHDRLRAACKPKDFYTLVVLFCAEAFVWIDGEVLFTGIDGSTRNLNWAKFLGLSPAEHTIPEHADKGLVTYEFPLSNWMK